MSARDDDEAAAAERLGRTGHPSESHGKCAYHAPISSDALMQLAMVGSRASAFHHDCASKLQGLVMALDELTELSENGDPQLIHAIESALESTRELNALLNLNRALTKAPAKAAIRLGELVATSARRVGISVQGALPDASVSVAIAAVTHALSLAMDVAGGVGRSRQLAISSEMTIAGAPGAVTLTLGQSPPAPTSASELLAIAAYAIARDGGAVWCSDDGSKLFVRLPLASVA